MNSSFPFRILAVLASCLFAVSAMAADPIKVLFLGDPQKGHHEPIKRFDWVKTRFEQAGIVETYTENMADLNDANLAKYDVLMVYANIAKISPEQQKAVMDFVSSGHGFVPVHCASACFGNSPEMIALMGARFAHHKTGVFAPEVVSHVNPIMHGFPGYETWDETYVHDQHNEKDRTVLMVRSDKEGNEPWTWTRTQGKGRVFYTASGHDERTWTNAAFQELLVRGVAWAAGPKGSEILVNLSGDTAKIKGRVPLKYEPRPTVQNYEKRDPYPLYQFPLSPKDSMDYTHVEDGFDLQLFASEPDVMKPIALAWDHRGRLWITETVDYPNTFTEQGQGHDRIKICEDTDGDGKADKFTVFAEGLNIVSGIVFVNGGVLVSQAPYLMFLKDTNGDDKADIKENVIEGWGKGDTHAGPSNLHYGFDNSIYGCVGYSGFAGDVGGKRVEMRQAPWRLARDFKTLEQIGQFSNNSWGMAFNEAGEIFGSTANNAHMFYVPIPIPYFKTVYGLTKDESAQKSVKMDAHYLAHPLTDKIRQVDVFGGYTAEAGQNFYTARSFPEKYWNNCALVCEPTMHLLHQGFVKRDGSGWTEDGDGMNLVASEEEWFAPVHAEVGPDGAVWMADWYNFIIQHNPTPSKDRGGFDTKTGQGNAHENPLRDHERGRIYRIVWKGAKAEPKIVLDPNNGAQLVATLKNNNMFWRLTAQRLLVERGNLDVVPALIELAKDQGVDKAGINGGVIHAMWTLHGLKQLDGSNKEALAAAIANLKHPSPAVRRNAAQVLPVNADSAKALLASGILDDADVNVRLAAILAASMMPANEEIGSLLFAQMSKPEVQGDKYLPLAIKIAAAHHEKGFFEAEFKAGSKIAAPASEAPVTSSANLFPNADFEMGADGKPENWKSAIFNGKSEFKWVEGGRNGGHCVEISSTSGGDTGWQIVVPCKPHHNYTLGGWVKTKDLKGARGAQFNVHNLQHVRTEAINGTKDWTFLSTSFNSEGDSSLIVNCLFGGWGQSTGTAWFDDVVLTDRGAGASNNNASEGATERIVARQAAHDLSVSDQIALLSKATGDAGLAAALLDGFSAGWSEQAAPPALAASDRETLKSVAGKLNENNQRRLAFIAEKWGAREGLPGLAGAAPTQAATKTVSKLSETDQKRFDSGKMRYMTICIACHGFDGGGLPAVAPPLAKSEWVTGSEQRLVRIVLQGLTGAVTVAGTKFVSGPPAAAAEGAVAQPVPVMVPWKDILDDTAISEILTYIRHEWGNDAKPVSAGTVKKIRTEEKERKASWSAEELQKIK